MRGPEYSGGALIAWLAIALSCGGQPAPTESGSPEFRAPQSASAARESQEPERAGPGPRHAESTAPIAAGSQASASAPQSSAPPEASERPESPVAANANTTPDGAASPTAADPPSPATPAAKAPAGPRFVTAGPHGVKEITLDGTEIRTVSTTPGRSPRWLPGRKAVIFVGVKGGRSRDLRRLDLATGDEKRLARLPLELPCPDSAYDNEDYGGPPELDLTNEDELFVTKDGRHACLVLADHEADLRTMQRELAVAVRGGRLRSSWVISDDSCEDAPQEEALAQCELNYDDFADDDEEETLPIPGYVESRSPDGKWALVRVASMLGDVVHTQYVLYRDSRGRAYPVSQGGGTRWPKPVELPETIDDYDLVDGLPEVAGNLALHWVGPRHLIVGRTLFIAGRRVVQLDGDAAY